MSSSHPCSDDCPCHGKDSWDHPMTSEEKPRKNQRARRRSTYWILFFCAVFVLGIAWFALASLHEGRQPLQSTVLVARQEHQSTKRVPIGELMQKVRMAHSDEDKTLALQELHEAGAVPLQEQGPNSPASSPNLEKAGGLKEGFFRIVNRKSGKCVDVRNKSTHNGSVVCMWEHTGGKNQQWMLTLASNGSYRLIAGHSGKALNVLNGNNDEDGLVGQWDANDDAAQRWRVESIDSHWFRLIAECSGKALCTATHLADSGSHLVQRTPGNDEDQQWALEPVDGIGPDPSKLAEMAELATRETTFPEVANKKSASLK